MKVKSKRNLLLWLEVTTITMHEVDEVADVEATVDEELKAVEEAVEEAEIQKLTDLSEMVVKTKKKGLALQEETASRVHQSKMESKARVSATRVKRKRNQSGGTGIERMMTARRVKGKRNQSKGKERKRNQQSGGKGKEGMMTARRLEARITRAKKVR